MDGERLITVHFLVPRRFYTEEQRTRAFQVASFFFARHFHLFEPPQGPAVG